MRKLLLILVATIATIPAHAAKVIVDRIEPTNWYVGLKDPSVQLMVYGQGIRDVFWPSFLHHRIRVQP